MGALRVERTSSGEWVAARGGGAWQRFDIQLTFYAAALAVIGLLMAYSNSSGPALAPNSTFTRGLLWLAVAIAVFAVAAAFDTRWLRTFAWLIYLINIALLIATLAVGSGVGGVSRWVSIFGLQFQFSEVAKILMIGVLAAYLAAHALATPDREAIACGEVRLSFGEVDDQSTRLANGLASRGVGSSAWACFSSGTTYCLAG
jgi:cell division protein FtsW (lipid II flippase)